MSDRIDVIVQTDEVSIVGPPEIVRVQYDIGPVGRRGSLWFTGSGLPSELTIPDYDQLLVGDMYMNSIDGRLYQRILLPSNQADWVFVGQSANGPEGDPTLYEMRGTGMPNGVVVAPIGTYYTDTAGTNGAWRWLKKTGTGNTGWGVIHGDTGWRDISSLLVAGNWEQTPGSLLIRRANSQVYLRLWATPAAGKIGITGSIWWDVTVSIPAGFQSPNPAQSDAPIAPVWIYGGSTLVLRQYSPIKLSVWGSPSGAISVARHSSEPTWNTANPWPTTLPGTAA